MVPIHKPSAVRPSTDQVHSQPSLLAAATRCRPVHPSRLIGFLQPGLEKGQVTPGRDQRVIALFVIGAAGNGILQVQRNGPLEIGLFQHAAKLFPVDHAFAERAVDLLPAGAGLLPVKILDGDHLHSGRGEVKSDLPAGGSALADSVANIEIVAGPFRVEFLHRPGDIGDGPAQIAFVIMKAGGDAVP